MNVASVNRWNLYNYICDSWLFIKLWFLTIYTIKTRIVQFIPTKGNHSTSDSNFLSFHPHPQWFKGFRMRPKWRAEAGMIGLWTGMASPGPSPSCHSMVSPVILRPALSFQWQQLEWHRNEIILIIRPFLKGLGLEWEILRTFGQNLHFSSEWVGMACKWVQNDKINQNDSVRMSTEWWNDIRMMEWHQNDGMISEWWNDIGMMKLC